MLCFKNNLIISATWFVFTINPPVTPLPNIHALAVDAVELILAARIQTQNQACPIALLAGNAFIIFSMEKPLIISEGVLYYIGCGIHFFVSIKLRKNIFFNYLWSLYRV